MNVAPAGATGDFVEWGSTTADAPEYVDALGFSPRELPTLFAVRVFGDSMEPALRDRSVIVCRWYSVHDNNRPPIPPGQCVFIRFSEEFRRSECALCCWGTRGDKVVLTKFSPDWGNWSLECSPEDILQVAIVVQQRTEFIPRKV